MVRALGDVIPGTHERLEPREGRVHFPGHGALLGFVLDDLGSKLLELTKHRRRVLDDLHLALELGPETLERDRVLRVKVGEAVNLDGSSGVV
jgi:hypothetical protein